jgi:hypothetical protein
MLSCMAGRQPADMDSMMPRLRLPGRLVGRRLTLEDGQLAAVFEYDDGLVITLIPLDDQVRFKANREYAVDGDGVVVFAAATRPS